MVRQQPKKLLKDEVVGINQSLFGMCRPFDHLVEAKRIGCVHAVYSDLGGTRAKSALLPPRLLRYQPSTRRDGCFGCAEAEIKVSTVYTAWLILPPQRIG